jgi:glutamine cyclotransferase
LLTLQRVGVTNVVRVTDEAKSFTGTVTMPGDGWNISAWSYNLAMADGSGTIGDGCGSDRAQNFGLIRFV